MSGGFDASLRSAGQRRSGAIVRLSLALAGPAQVGVRGLRDRLIKRAMPSPRTIQTETISGEEIAQ